MIDMQSYFGITHSGRNTPAVKIHLGQLTLYVSYSTVVGFHDPVEGHVFHENDWGPTTGRHMSDWGAPDQKDRQPAAVFDPALGLAFKREIERAAGELS